MENQVKQWVPWRAPIDTEKDQFINLKDVLQECSTSQPTYPPNVDQQVSAESQDDALSVLSMETGLLSIDRNFEIKNSVMNLPKSPYKNIVRVGAEQKIISDSSIEVATIQTVSKRLV